VPGDNNVGSYYCPYWSCVSRATWQKAEHTVLFCKGTAAPDCASGTCKPINFTALKPSDWKQGYIVSIRIDGKGLDPRTLMHLKLVTITHKSPSYKVYLFFYEEMWSEFSISIKARNLFLSLALFIAQTLNITSCYICGEPTWESIGHGKLRS
jgi:hypothetical protein